MTDELAFCPSCGKSETPPQINEVPCDIIHLINCLNLNTDDSFTILSVAYKAQDEIKKLRDKLAEAHAQSGIDMKLDDLIARLEASSSAVLNTGFKLLMLEAATTIKWLREIVKVM